MAVKLTITQRKGGAGKSTLACQLAAAFVRDGFRVQGIDLDEQGSFSNWAQLRAAREDVPSIAVHHCERYELGGAMRRAERDCDVIIIDTAPTADSTVKRALREADLAIVPLQLSPLDLDATLPTARLIGEAGQSALFVVNRAPPRARIADMIREQIHKQRLPLAETELGNRTAFSESLARGRGVVETAPSSPAAKEISALAAEIRSRFAMADAA